MFLNTLINSIIELAVFLVFPFIAYLFTYRKKLSFPEYIGLIKIERKNIKRSLTFILILSALFIIISLFMLYMVKDVPTAASKFTSLGISALPSAIIYSTIGTAIPEEIIFRGFIAKIFVRKNNYLLGNIVQSTLFGLLHAAMFYIYVGMLKAIITGIFTFLIAYLVCYTNEKKANSSIIPSIIVHSMANLFSCLIAMFSIMYTF